MPQWLQDLMKNALVEVLHDLLAPHVPPPAVK